MSTSVKRIESTMRGAPTLNGTAGTLLAVLEALFVTGWGPTTALSVNVSGGIATATLTPGESFDRDAVVLVAGATPSALNGEARVLTTSSSSITWATTAPDGAATGTITIRYAPQTSWSKVNSATNKAAFRSTHVQSAGHYLRIDDTGTTTARVRGYESMTDVDTGAGPFPTDAQMSGGGYLRKSTSSTTDPVKYKLFCDERFVLICVSALATYGAKNTSAVARGFGDPITMAPGGDAWATVISCGAAGYASDNVGGFADGSLSSGFYGAIYSARGHTGLGGAAMMDSMPQSGTVGSISGSDSYFGPGPSAIDGQIKTCRRMLRASGSSSAPRSIVPGVLYIPQSGIVTTVSGGDVFTGSGDLAGRRLMAIGTAGNVDAEATGMYLVDITGPWR